jgi:hypothetical protein
MRSRIAELPVMSDLLARLYPDHLATLRQRADAALARGGFDHLVVAAGVRPTSSSTTVRFRSRSIRTSSIGCRSRRRRVRGWYYTPGKSRN